MWEIRVMEGILMNFNNRKGRKKYVGFYYISVLYPRHITIFAY